MSSPKRTPRISKSSVAHALLSASAGGACAIVAAWAAGYSVGFCCFAAGCAAVAGGVARAVGSPSWSEAAPRTVLSEAGHIIAPTASPDDVRDALEHLVRARIECDAVELQLRGATGRLAERGGSPQASGAHRIVRSEIRAEHEIAAPIAFDGAVFGELMVCRRRGSRGFLAQDAAALQQIAAASGFMVAHAVAYSELEERRRQQAAAFRDEREALVETLSAEIAHEVRYPINFFRSIFQRASEDRVLERDDLEIGSEEVERLERLVSGLRRMAIHVERRTAPISELAARAEVLLRDRMSRNRLALDLGSPAALRCDVDKITQVLVNLLANALDATEQRGEIGLDWRLTPHGGELLVWDTGAGFSGDATRLFAPWYTTKPRGTGLGLAIAYRMVRAHGWTIEGMRREGRTVFVIMIPLGDVTVGPRLERARDYVSGQGPVSPVLEMPVRREGAA